MKISEFVQLLINKTMSARGHSPDRIWLTPNYLAQFIHELPVAAYIPGSTTVLYSGVEIKEDTTYSTGCVGLIFDSRALDSQYFDFNNYASLTYSQASAAIRIDPPSSASFGSPQISGTSPQPVMPGYWGSYALPNYTYSNANGVSTVSGAWTVGVPGTAKITLPPGVTTKEFCNHSWQKYIGFTDSFDFCTVCNEKKRE